MKESSDTLEPILDTREIQGNILAGFNKDHQSLLGFTIQDAAMAKRWIGLISSYISTLFEVYHFNKLFKSVRQRLEKEPPGLVATWTNIAFSYPALKKLVEDLDKVDSYLDHRFKAGLISRSQALGDPVDTTAEGNYNNWVVGGPKSHVDIFVIMASDQVESLQLQVQLLKDKANQHNLTKVYEETGHDLSFYGREEKRGREHFGFRDGISQPGIRGRISDNADDYLTSRPSPPTDDSALPEFGRNGRPLIAPGEFVLGYPTQNENHPRMANPAEPFPDFLRNGSYLVFRRLRQDVEGFENFVKRESSRISELPGFSGMNTDKFKSILVGRWPSGAPLSLSPNQDDPELAKDRNRNNAFGYANDLHGHRTPIISHIRKVNTRDLATDIGGPSKTLRRRILRRGIPFGVPLDYARHESIAEDRGLLFLSYQACIEDQFEFLVTRWMNSITNPTNAPSPGGHDSGFDLVVGQNPLDRVRYAHIQTTMDSEIVEGGITTKGLNILDWVIPTGGGYFFSPSISSLRNILGSNN
jgi:Dyp-type peroxidase family